MSATAPPSARAMTPRGPQAIPESGGVLAPLRRSRSGVGVALFRGLAGDDAAGVDAAEGGALIGVLSPLVGPECSCDEALSAYDAHPNGGREQQEREQGTPEAGMP